jgi:hypothetical protein
MTMKKLMQLFITAILIVGFVSCSSDSGTTIFVSPSGNDTNPGTEKKPFATISHARDIVRRLKEDHSGENITVYLRGGDYRLLKTLVFSTEDSGDQGQIITYKAFPGEKPVISSDFPVKNWEKPTCVPDGLPEKVKENIWVADVSGITKIKENQEVSPSVANQMDRTKRFFTLYDGKTRLQRARGKDFSLVQMERNDKTDPQTFRFPEKVLKNWTDIKDAELHLIPHYIWVSNILPLESVIEKEGLARVAVPCTYILNPPKKMKYKSTAFVENALALLDEPGEWVLHSETNILYYWPKDGKPGDHITAPLLTELIRVEGDIDYEGATDIPVKNLVFEGLTFTRADRFPWHGKTGWGIQHDWERFDSPSAMFRFRGAENCVIENCHFTTAGSTGIRFDLYCQNNKVIGNHIEHIGGAGILLAGYGPGTKDVNRKNEISNNLMHDIGEFYFGSSAIFAWQSGENTIAHNHLYNLPYTGILATGRIVWDPEGKSECSKTVRWKEVGGKEKVAELYWNRDSTWYQREKYLHSRNNMIYRNDIHNATQVTGDANCIYISGAGRGNVVLENYCHDIYGPRMHTFIRCDDDQNETRIERNILYKYYEGRGEGITSKGKNDIVGNLVIDLRNSPVDRHRGYIVFPDAPVVDSKVQENILYSMKKGQFTYGQGNVLIEGNPNTRLYPERLWTTKADRNIYFCTKDPDFGASDLKKAQKHGVEKRSLVADPMFTDIENEDFSFKAGSPALKLGIRQPVPVDSTGLQPSYKNSWESIN